MNIAETLKHIQEVGISVTDYLEKFPGNTFTHGNEIIQEIEKTRSQKNASALEDLLVLALWDGLDNRYTQTFTQLLGEKWHHSQEDIVEMLGKIKDPVCIEILYSTALNIPEHDDGRSLAKKCIWSLAALNTPEARNKILLLTRHHDAIIRDTALLQMSH
jgi:hypothetical protein